MRKATMILGLLLLSLICKSQVRDGDNVVMPVQVYRDYRTTILECDTLKSIAVKAETECDSIISLQDNRIAGKDSVITNLNHKLDLKNREIEILNKPEPKITIKGLLGFICGGIAGSVWTILMVK